MKAMIKSILEEIQSLIFEFRISTGLEPKRIYLGEQEFISFEQEVEQYCHFKNTEIVSKNQFCGLTVYKVYSDGLPHMRVFD